MPRLPEFRLRYVIAMMANAVLVGTFLIVLLALGFFHWLPITIAIILGFALSHPVGVLIAKAIKADDPLWNERADRPTMAELRDRTAREAAMTPPPSPATR